MGQKVNPISYRQILRKAWRSKWYANKGDFGRQLKEDHEIRQFLMKRSCCQGASRVEIRRMSDKLEITIRTSRPGLVIGKKGAEIDLLRKALAKMTGKQVWIEVEEVKRPDLEAQIVADSIARQLERRMPFRRVLRKVMQSTMDAGAVGIKVQVSGRLGGAEIARTEWYKEGSIPLHTLRANIDYATGRAETTYGSLGVKVWINCGEEVAKPVAKKGAA